MPNLLGRFLSRGKEEFPICSAVVPAAGFASRMGGTDKMFMTLGEVPILVHTLRALQRSKKIHEIVVVTREEFIVPVGQLCKDWDLKSVSKIIVGGGERLHSVLAGVREVRQDAELIAIHDGARPFLAAEVLDAVLVCGAKTGAAALAVPVIDTIKRAQEGRVTETLNREELWAVQTPQVFEAALIRAALEKGAQEGVPLTDDCAAVERMGMKVSLVPGDRANLKITTPFDLTLGEAILQEIGNSI